MVSAFDQVGVSIQQAVITTIGHQVIDTFYITSDDHEKLLKSNFEESLKQALMSPSEIWYHYIHLKWLKKLDFNIDCDNLYKTLYPDDTEGSGPLKCRASLIRIKVLMPAHSEISGRESIRLDSSKVLARLF